MASYQKYAVIYLLLDSISGLWCTWFLYGPAICLRTGKCKSSLYVADILKLRFSKSSFPFSFMQFWTAVPDSHPSVVDSLVEYMLPSNLNLGTGQKYSSQICTSIEGVGKQSWGFTLLFTIDTWQSVLFWGFHTCSVLFKHCGYGSLLGKMNTSDHFSPRSLLPFSLWGSWCWDSSRQWEIVCQQPMRL